MKIRFLTHTIKSHCLLFVFHSGRGILVRNIIFPVLGAFLLLPFGLDRLTYIALVILIGTPCAAITSILAERFDRSPSFAAQLVSLSTLVSAITLPLMAVLAEVLAK